jgi:hypothetical protein
MYSSAYGWDALGGTSLYKDVHILIDVESLASKFSSHDFLFRSISNNISKVFVLTHLFFFSLI